MAKKNKEPTNASVVFKDVLLHRLREGLLLLSFTLALFLTLSLASYHHSDPGWSNLIESHHVANAGGEVGAYIADFLLSLFGYFAYTLPVIICYAAFHVYRYKHRLEESIPFNFFIITLRVVGFISITSAGTGLWSLCSPGYTDWLPSHAGGIVGTVMENVLVSRFNTVGAFLLLVCLLLISVTLLFGFSWTRFLESIGSKAISCWRFMARSKISIDYSHLKKRFGFMLRVFTACRTLKNRLFRQQFQREPATLPCTRSASMKPKRSVKQSDVVDVVDVVEDSRDILMKPKPRIARSPRFSRSKSMPRLDLLDVYPKQNSPSKVDYESRSQDVEQTLLDYGIQVSVTAVHPGPVVTRYELQLAAGTKASKITNLAKDLARSLSVISVRVVEVIPGKSVVGIELPNQKREVVSLRDVIATKQYTNFRSPLCLALGHDIAGHPVVVDLAKMPHLLVAGTTGSGKSVCLNAMLLSLLYKSTPEQLRIILIDPKMLELSVYDDIPHLLTPVVTDMKDAANALRWCVAEMERRYRLMASLGVRNIAGYNDKVKQAQKRGAPLLDPLVDENAPELQHLPQIVVIADEFADMMVVVGKKIETLITRLAQKARAAGIHLVLATQRPSVDVITGLIKANIPTRIAFQVSSKVDSRTILDQQGAEQLLGQGDMLYLPPGSGVPVRVHGAFVNDDEVHRVVEHLKSQAQPEYIDNLLDDISTQDPSGYISAASGESDGEQDDLYDAAVAFIAKARRVSVSSIQRRFKIGYNRAARIVETMEAAGVVSPMEGAGSREVLVPPPEE